MHKLLETVCADVIFQRWGAEPEKVNRALALRSEEEERMLQGFLRERNSWVKRLSERYSTC